MTIDEKIEQWKLLKKSKQTLDKKLTELRSEILNYVSEQPYNGVAKQIRDRTTYDESKVHELMANKGYYVEAYCDIVISSSKLEEMYLNDQLTDSDLRYIRVPRYTDALVEVESVDV